MSINEGRGKEKGTLILLSDHPKLPDRLKWHGYTLIPWG